LSNKTVTKLTHFKAYEIINKIFLFDELSPDEKHLIANTTNLFYLIPEKDVFIKEGELDNCFYFILSGSTKVTHNSIEFDKLIAGDIVGVVGFIRDSPRSTSVVAQSNVLALRFTRLQFKKLPANVRELIKDHMLEELVKRIDRLNIQCHPK